MTPTDDYIEQKCAELKIHLRDAERNLQKGALTSSGDDYRRAIEVIEDMKRYSLPSSAFYKKEESHETHSNSECDQNMKERNNMAGARHSRYTMHISVIWPQQKSQRRRSF
tara:strand:- start:54 stop:386 length:333 start_codon:yes stop_codon:yes gene_type:complete